MITNFQNVPRISIPIASCILDLYWRAFPERYSNKFKNRIDENLRTWLDKSAVLFAISKKTFDDLVEFFPIYKHKIKFIPIASVVATDDNVENDIVDFDKKLLNFYYPAGFSYRKNHHLLLEAVYKLALKGYMFKVVFTGEGTENITGDNSLLPTGLKAKMSFGSKHKMQQLADREKCRLFYQEHKEILKQFVLAMGYCHSETVKAFYGCCSCVVLPSSFEGFGLPFAEAITRGCPVICSDIDTFREQVDLYDCEDLIDFFPDKDVNALVNRLENFLRNPKVRLSPTEVKERFSRWEWKDVAVRYLNEMEGLC